MQRVAGFVGPVTADSKGSYSFGTQLADAHGSTPWMPFIDS